MVVGLADDFGLAAIYHLADFIDEVWGPFLGLFEPSTGNAERYFEAFMFLHVGE